MAARDFTGGIRENRENKRDQIPWKKQKGTTIQKKCGVACGKSMSTGSITGK